MRIKSYILSGLLLVCFLSPAWAASKSETIRISCSVPPMVQMSANSKVQTNLKNNFFAVETFEQRPAGFTKVISVTVL